REGISGGTFEVFRPSTLAEEGTEKRSFVIAEQAGALIWRFSGLRRTDFEETIHFESRFSVGSPTDQWRASGTILLEARGSGGSHRLEQFLNTNEEKDWSIPSAIVGEEGKLELAFRCGDPDGFLGGSRRDLSIYHKPGNFELAFARGLVLLFLQSMTVLSLTLMASAMLSAPLSILLGILLYIVGSAYGYVKDGTRDIDRSLQERQAGTAPPPLQDEIPPWFLQFSSKVSKAVLAIVPDFDHFDFSRWLLKDKAVSDRDLGVALGHALPPVLVLGFLGMAVLAFKDFG
ncbi:MAG TPA: hypothetical protein VEN81_07160, partial [Planctomycetota bacterium]|nr:hypothetical protein [Planctomycetota bacterium]